MKKKGFVLLDSPTKLKYIPAEKQLSDWIDIMEEQSNQPENPELMEKFKSFIKLAQNTSHDLNNTLFPILTGAELILEDVSDTVSVKESVVDIKESIEKAIDILSGFISETNAANDF